MVAIIQDLVVFNQHFNHSILSSHLVLSFSKEVMLILPTKLSATFAVILEGTFKSGDNDERLLRRRRYLIINAFT